MTKKWLKLKEKSLLTVLSVAPMPYLVEQLTLNQRAQGSSPWKCTTAIIRLDSGFFVFQENEVKDIGVGIRLLYLVFYKRCSW